MTGRRVHVFISYAHADRGVADRLATHLRWLEHDERIELFDDSKLVAGEKWEQRLLAEIAKADIIILVATADFTASRYCTKVELKRALARAETEGICLLPVLAAPCDWEAMPITNRQTLPKDTQLRLKPVIKWGRPGSAGREEAFTQIAQHVRSNVQRLAAVCALPTNSQDPDPVRRLVSWRAAFGFVAEAVTQSDIEAMSYSHAIEDDLAAQLKEIEQRRTAARVDYLQRLLTIQEKEIDILKRMLNPPQPTSLDDSGQN